MQSADILDDYEQLPHEAKQQVADFIAFMKSKHQVGNKQKPKISNSTAGSFGSIHVTRSATLEEMDAAIMQEGGRL